MGYWKPPCDCDGKKDEKYKNRLRDEIAMSYLQGLMSAGTQPDKVDWAIVAKNAYIVADTFIARGHPAEENP